VILPSYISIIVILLFLGSIEENTRVLGAFEGIKAASAAMILVAAYKLGRQILKGKVELFIAAISFAVIVFAGINAIWAILFGGLTGLVVYQYNKRKGRAE
jgi:chromate transporter